MKKDNYRLPEELNEFINQSTYSLLIKGDVGSGKTSLALSIMFALKNHARCLFLSTRTSPEKLFEQFKWLNKNSWGLIKSKNENLEINTEIATFIDSRLDEPISLYERITNELMDVKSPIIIIDSWDAISSFMDNESLLSNARVLQTWRERAQAKIIFVSESKNKNILDFWSDGIVEVERNDFEGRVLRKILLKKLRGHHIKRPEYFFTLNQGFFKTLPPYNPEDLEINTKSNNKGNQKKNIHPITGYKNIDNILEGKLPKDSSIHIESTNRIGDIIPIILFKNLIAKRIREGYHVIIQTNTELKRKYIKNIFDFFTNEQLNRLEIVYNKHDDTESLQKFRSKIMEIKEGKKPICIFLTAEFIQNDKVDEFVTKDVKAFFEFNKQNSDLMIISSKSNDSSTNTISKFCEFHCKILEIAGTLFFISDMPWSPLFGLLISNERKPQVSLEPIV